ncbi:MAG TPA: sn-glycerol-3-phosphate ABC transporter ATP-binding protein UgpC [Planctomycetota bacterium]|nr:sn-glycerol-3-phosphate ABC transporter ATP-binding protein UgpC [Planctomycetota bacterium]
MTAVDDLQPSPPSSATSRESKVTLRQIRKVYPGGVEAVKGVDLDVYQGEFCVLVGPSGCGKSTILRMIAGLETVTAGDLTIAGVRANDLHPKDRNIAMVFQDYALYPHMTVYENMAFGLRLRQPRTGTQRAADTLMELASLGYWQPEVAGLDAAVKRAAATLGIENLLARKPAQLSGGQRQRVAMGRAIVRDPAVFLFDEPLSNLDAKLRVDMRVELSRLHSRLKATVVYVTHDQVEAMTLGSRIVVMDHGVIRQVDSPMNLYNKPADRFVATFIGSPTMNILPATLASVGGQVFVKCGSDFSLPLPGANPPPDNWEKRSPDVDLGIRPEHILVDEGSTSTPVLTAEALVIEQLGDYQLVVAKIGNAEFTARAVAERPIHVGQEIPIRFLMEKAHLFDRETGQSLRKQT